MLNFGAALLSVNYLLLLIFITLTFLFKTPHLVKSVIRNLYSNPVGSSGSGLIWQTGSTTGSVARSSANNGAPRKPSGLRRSADTESLMPVPPLENVHWMSVTGKYLQCHVNSADIN